MQTKYPMPTRYRCELVRESKAQIVEIGGSQDAADIFRQHLGNADREHLMVLMMDAKGRAIGINTVHIGALSMCVVGPPEVFRPAVISCAASVIACHNHPSGDPTPSPEDISTTQRLIECGKLLNIEFMDHIILGDEGAFKSLSQMGYIPA